MAGGIFRAILFLACALFVPVSSCFAQQDSVKTDVDTVKKQEASSLSIPSAPTISSVSANELKNKTDKTVDSLKSLVRIDSAEKKRLKKKLLPKTQGNISAGYDYGIIPFAANTTLPLGYYSSQGNVGFSVLGLPLNASYYYSSLKNVAGLNNYFKISFDPPRYQQMLKEKGLKKVEEEKAKLSNLKNLQQSMEQKLAYQQISAMDIPSQALLNQKLQEYKEKYGSYQVPSIPGTGADTLKNLQLPTNPYADSIRIILPKPFPIPSLDAHQFIQKIT